MAELVDAPHSKCGAQKAWGFDSLYPHHFFKGTHNPTDFFWGIAMGEDQSGTQSHIEIPEAPHLILESENGPPEPDPSLKYKILGLLVLIVGGVYGIIAGERGSAIFSFSSSTFFLCAILPPKTYRDSLESLRTFFQSGDRTIRILMIVLAVGGTALIAKYGITGFSFLPPYVDVIVKRMGPALAVIAVILYPSAIISKRVFVLSTTEKDEALRRVELLYYVAIVLLCATVIIFCACFPIEKDLVSYWQQGVFKKTGRTELPYLGKDALSVIAYTGLIWAVWAISFASIIVLRFLDWSWRELPYRR
jgi:uncharacterized membrane protein